MFKFQVQNNKNVPYPLISITQTMLINNCYHSSYCCVISCQIWFVWEAWTAERKASMKAYVNQSISRSIDQSIDQSINQIVRYMYIAPLKT